jgi:hypothetical protein
MGYYTNYSLEYEILEETEEGKTSSTEERLVEEMNSEDACQYGSLMLFVREGVDCKWYEHDEEMKPLSAKFPTVLFTLKGEGEESGDLWVKYYLAGKSQMCQGITAFEPFDKEKLT